MVIKIEFIVIAYIFVSIHLRHNPRNSTGCPCKLNKPKDNDDPRHFRVKRTHSHAPDARKLGKKKVMTNIKHRAKTTRNPAHQIISESLIDIPKAVSAEIVSTQQLVQTINRVRQDPEAPKNPTTLAEIVFSEKYSKTASGKDFILFDSGTFSDEDDNRIIIFGTRENLDFLAKCHSWYMDGTFNIAPRLFQQLYTIHGEYLKNRCIFIIR